MHTNVLEKLVRRNDRDVQFALAHQVSDGSRNDGGVIDPGSGLPAASHGGTVAYIASMTAALYSAKSSYYRSETVLAALDRALSFMLRRQHEDGTISLGSTNFNSPPDTAFVVNGIAQIYLLPHTHVQQHQLAVELEQGANEWTIRLSSDQRYDVMTQIVLLFPKEAQLAGEELQEAGEYSWLWGGGALRCTSGSDCLQLSGGARQHEAMHMRNSLQQGGAQKVVINLVTPFVHELKISLLQI